MKASTVKISISIAIMALALPGCLDIWFTSEVNRDGSIDQSVVFQGDSTEILNAPFVFLKQEGWKHEWSKPEKDKSKLVISRKFKSAKEMNQFMNPADSGTLAIRTHTELHRKFRWFFTRFEFRQTVREVNPFKGLDYRNYLSEDDIRMITTGEEQLKKEPDFDSVKYQQADKRAENYLLMSMYEDLFVNFVKLIDEDKSLEINRDDFVSRKEQIFRFLTDSVKGDGIEPILEGFAKAYPYPGMVTIRNKYADRFAWFNEKTDFFGNTSDDSYHFAVRMPGLLLQANSTDIKGSEITWNLDYYQFYFRDYTMTAESRVINDWAFAVAGLVFLLAIGGLFGAFRRKRL